MTNTELKYDLIRLIIQLDDYGVLQSLKKMIVGKTKESDYDWAEELSDEQLELIKLGEEQLKNGEFLSGEEVHLGAKELLERKRKQKNSK